MSHDAPNAFRKYEHAGAYHYALMEQDPFYEAKIRKALALVSPGTVVLDVGCGDGVFIKYGREKGVTVVGMDSSEHGVALARTMAGSRAVCVGSAQALPFGAASIDAVILIDVVNYLSDCEAAVREAARALRPGGLLVIMSPVEVSLEDERSSIPDSWQVQAWTSDALRALVERHLAIAEISFIEKVLPKGNPAVLSRVMQVLRVLRLDRVIARVARARRGDGAATGAVPASGNVVLNRLSLPSALIRGRERLEFILVAQRQAEGSR